MNKPKPHVLVTIPILLRTPKTDVASVSVHARSVKEAITALAEADPELARRLLLPEGGIRRNIAVFVGAQDIRMRDGWDTKLREGDEIALLCAFSGG